MSGANAEGAYDALAADYHWLFADDQVGGQAFAEQYAAVLAMLPPGAKVLDCACGAGFDAMALARAGFAVTATDASEGMVEEARRRCAAAGLDIPVSRCSWAELPSRFAPSFDGVFCIGNSIAHCPGPEAMSAAFAGMHAALVPGGRLVVESRDWEAMRAEGQRLEARRPVVRDDARGFCVYLWTIPEGWDEAHLADLVVTVERDGGLEHRLIELSFSAYTKEELIERMVDSGFENPQVFERLSRRYIVTAQKSR